MTISRMQQPRQMYGLGSLVKSITKGVKKVVKSPIGKAAAAIFWSSIYRFQRFSSWLSPIKSGIMGMMGSLPSQLWATSITSGSGLLKISW
jgi:hypothetical protein